MAKKKVKEKPCPNCNPERGMMSPMYGCHQGCRTCKFVFRLGAKPVKEKIDA